MSGTNTEYSHELISQISDFLKEKLKACEGHLPKLAIICGTGLGNLADSMEVVLSLNYSDIPHFPLSTVQGHDGKLIFGKISGRDVVAMKGRFHLYEGYTAQTITLPVRVMNLLGVRVLLVTNAAGGLNSDYNVGDLMAIKDHIFLPGLGGNNPLVGPNDRRFGNRFPATSHAYNRELRIVAQAAADKLGLSESYREGVYAMNCGPSFESIAECRFLKAAGADVVGMSTCPEVVVAVHSGIKVFGMSMVTNNCVMDYDEDRMANHAEVLETGAFRSSDTVELFKEIVKNIPESMLEG